MANKRMFSLKIVDTDIFLDMPLSAQNLYFHLNMRADDDGFIANHKKIMRMIGCNDDDMKILLTKDFIIPFQSGVCVIKHWKIHNYIAKDRYHETIYIEEKETLEEHKNGMYTKCIQVVDKMNTQSSLGKTRLVLDKNKDVDLIIDYFNEITGQKRKHSKTSRTPIHSRLNDGFNITESMHVIKVKYEEWKDNNDMKKYLTIETLFRPSNFEKYLNQEEKKPTQDNTFHITESTNEGINDLVSRTYNE